MPTRGAKLFQSLAQSWPIGLWFDGIAYPVRIPSMIWCGVLVLTDTFGSP